MCAGKVGPDWPNRAGKESEATERKTINFIRQRKRIFSHICSAVRPMRRQGTARSHRAAAECTPRASLVRTLHIFAHLHARPPYTGMRRSHWSAHACAQRIWCACSYARVRRQIVQCSPLYVFDTSVNVVAKLEQVRAGALLRARSACLRVRVCLCVRVPVHVHVRARVRACASACVRACVRAVCATWVRVGGLTRACTHVRECAHVCC